MSNQIEQALSQIYGKVEPLTRYGRTTLKTDENSKVREVAGKAFTSYSASISNVRKEDKGQLPYYASAVENSERLEEIASRTYKSAYDEIPRRLQSWLRANGSSDRALQESDCFNGPQTFGYEYKCSTCHAEGWIQCSGCSGRGFNKCRPCNETGKIECTNCKGIIFSGKVKCKPCKASGKINGQRCSACGGKGKIVCPLCQGSLKVKHSACDGRGVLNCSKCKTTGKVTCPTCDGARYFHVLRTVSCTVFNRWRVKFQDAKAEVVQQLINRNLNELRQLAEVTQSTPAANNNSIEREYDFKCLITEVAINAAGEKKEIVGYGPKAYIYDFKNIVSALLKEDLNTLKNAVLKTPLKFWGNPAELVNSTKQFMASKVNVDVDNPSFTGQNIIDAKYANQVKEYLPKALRRIFASKSGTAFLAALAVLVLFSLAIYFTNLLEMAGLGIFIVPVLAAIITWRILENKIRNNLAVLLNSKVKGASDLLLKKYYVLWTFRAVVFLLTSAVFGILFAISVVGYSNETTKLKKTDSVETATITSKSSYQSNSGGAKNIAEKLNEATVASAETTDDDSDSNSNISTSTNTSFNRQEKSSNYGRFRIVTRDESGLNIRKSKGLSSEAISFVAEGDQVTILEYDSDFVYIHYNNGRVERGKWCWVQDDNGVQGWAWGHYLTNDPNFTRK